MNNASRILKAAGIERDQSAGNFTALADRPEFSNEGFIAGVDAFRRWLGAPPDAGGRRPSVAFFEGFLGFGRKGAEELLARFEESLPSDPTGREWIPTWKAAASAARVARREGSIGWDLNSWRPQALDSAKSKLSAYVPHELDERVRVLAFEEHVAISQVVERALSAELQRAEKRRGAPILPRGTEASPATA